MRGSAADGRVRVRRAQQQQLQRWRRSWTLTRSTCHPEGGLRSTSTSITLCARGPPAREEKGPCCLVSRGPSVTVSHPPNHSLGPSCMKRMKNVWTRGHPSARTYVPSCTRRVLYHGPALRVLCDAQRPEHSDRDTQTARAPSGKAGRGEQQAAPCCALGPPKKNGDVQSDGQSSGGQKCVKLGPGWIKVSS